MATKARARARRSSGGRPGFAARFRRLLMLWALAQDETLVSGVAGRYASALFSLAQDDRQTDAVAQSLSELDALIAGSPDLARLVRSPVFSANDQLKALDAILAGQRRQRRRPDNSPPPRKRGRPRKDEQRPKPEPTRLERQVTQNLGQMLADPTACDVGC